MVEQQIDRFGKPLVYIAAAIFIGIILCCLCCCMLYAVTYAAMEAGIITPIP